MAFEYRYAVSVDEEIIPRYGYKPGFKFMFETRVKFIVIDENGGERVIDSERYVIPARRKGYEEIVRFRLGLRLKDYWMSVRQIHRLITQFGRLAKRTASGRRGVIPAAVDLDVCTVQRKGEAIDATAQRAMRPEFLPPLHLYPRYHLYPHPLGCGIGKRRSMTYVEGKLPAIRVEDVERASSVMEVCGLCARKPMVGTRISPLRCGHAFHYHCVVPLLLEKGNACPICLHHPAFDKNAKEEDPNPEYTLWCFWRSTQNTADFDSDDDFLFSDDDFDVDSDSDDEEEEDMEEDPELNDF